MGRLPFHCYPQTQTSWWTVFFARLSWAPRQLSEVCELVGVQADRCGVSVLDGLLRPEAPSAEPRAQVQRGSGRSRGRAWCWSDGGACAVGRSRPPESVAESWPVLPGCLACEDARCPYSSVPGCLCAPVLQSPIWSPGLQPGTAGALLLRACLSSLVCRAGCPRGCWLHGPRGVLPPLPRRPPGSRAGSSPFSRALGVSLRV